VEEGRTAGFEPDRAAQQRDSSQVATRVWDVLTTKLSVLLKQIDDIVEGIGSH